MITDKSPNELWRILGATVERFDKPKKHRVITLQDGRSFSALYPFHANEVKLAGIILSES